MTEILPFLLVGLTTGSVYALAGMGLVLTYRTSGLFNFAHGALAAVGGFGYFVLSTRLGLPTWLAALLTVLVLPPLGGLLLEVLANRLTRVSTAMQVVGTVGLLILIQGGLVWAFGAETRLVTSPLPTDTFVVSGLQIGYDQLIIVLLTLGVTVVLYRFLGSRRSGLLMQAVVDDEELVQLSGANDRRVRQIAWTIGTAFAVVSGVLIVPTIGVDATFLTLLVVQAFGAAAVGAFTSLPLTYIGGLGIGVASSLATRFAADFPTFQGVPSSLGFIVLFVALVAYPKGKLFAVSGERPLDAVTIVVRNRRMARAMIGVGIAGALLLPLVVGGRLPSFTQAAVLAIIFLSLDLLVRTSGQVSLTHAAFVAVGAAVFGHLLGGGLPAVVALLLAGTVTALVAAAVAVPAIRLSGIYLAIATLGFGILLERVAYRQAFMFGSTGRLEIDRPRLLGLPTDSDIGYYYLVLAVLAIAALVLGALKRGRLGSLLRGLANAPTTLTTLGAEVNLTRTIAFCISGFVAGVAGALFGGVTGSITGSPFNWFTSLQWIVVLCIVPTGLLGAVIAGILLAVVPLYATAADPATIGAVLLGALVIGMAVSNGRPRFPRERLASPRRPPGSPGPSRRPGRERPSDREPMAVSP